MKLFKLLALAILMALPARAGQHTIGGDPVINAIGGFYYGINSQLGTGATTNLSVDFDQPVTVWTPGPGAAIRFSLFDKPTAATNGGWCQLQINAQAGTLLTNVADAIVWKGPWGVLNAGTNYIDIWWDGVTLNAHQSPTHGVITPPQITSNQNDYTPTGVDIADEMRVNSDAARSITGMAGRAGGQELIFENTGSFVITLANSSGSSVSSNRFLFAQDVAVGVNQSVHLIYDTTSLKWRLGHIVAVTEPNLAFTDVTAGNATTSLHGLLKKLDGNSAHFLDGTGAWAVPPSATVTTNNLPVTAWLTTDYTTNTTIVPVDLPGCQISVLANHTYSVSVVILVAQVGTLAGYRVLINGPASPTSWFIHGFDDGNTSINSKNPVQNFTTAFTGGTGAAAIRGITLLGTLINGVNAGTLSIQIAQSVSDSGNTTYKAGCLITVRQLD